MKKEDLAKKMEKWTDPKLRKWARDWCNMQIHEYYPLVRPCLQCIRDSKQALIEAEMEDEG